MPQIAIPILISAAGTAGTVGAAGGVAAFGGWAAVGGILATNVAIGAAVGAIGMLAENVAKGKDPRDREVNDVLQSRAQRNIPLPVVFGRGRVAGNYIHLGNFFEIDDFAKTQGGTQYYVMNAILALSEGRVRATGNWQINGTSRDDYEENIKLEGSEDEKAEKRLKYAYFASLAGHPEASLTALGDFYDYVDTSKEDNEQPAFTITDVNKIPYRNTAIALVRAVCSTTGPDFIDIGCDILGPDFTLRRSHSFTEGYSGNTRPLNTFYDAHTESWYCTIRSRDSAAPWGVHRYNRNGGAEEITAVPSVVTNSAENAWYLGRHDILVIQNPDSHEVFHIGRWGLAPDSTEWGTHHLGRNYQYPMLAWQLDELHGILHSFHDDAARGVRVINRWWLLTGRMERVETNLGTGNFRHMMFDTERNCYVIISDNRIHLVSWETGIEFDSRAKDNTDSKGVFTAGVLIGVIFGGHVRYWHPQDNIDVTYDSEGTAITSVDNEGEDWEIPKPYLENAYDARQNTWTNQVSLGCGHGASYGFVTFIPSVVEPREENTFIASPDADDITPYHNLLARRWVRDWSYRIPGASKLRLLEGESSIAAAAYAAIFAVPEFNSSRWGGGLSESFGSLPSFESLHARCVAPERYIRSNSSRWETDLALKKAYEFTVQDCGSSDKHTETFQPDDSSAYVWRSTEGGKLWYNSEDSDLYDEDLDADDKFVMQTSEMASHDRYLVGNSTNSKSPPTSRSAWKNGKHSPRCPAQYHGQILVQGSSVKLAGIRAVARGTDTINSPEQKAELIFTERYKVDYVLDAQTSMSQLVDDILLAACNGYRTIIDGKLHVGINPPGRLMMMALTDDLRIGSGSEVLAAGQQPNLVLLQYQNRFDEYRSDFQPAYDDFEQDATGQAILESPSNPGITRPAHAQKIASLMIDTTASHRRQYSATYKFNGLALSAGDVVGIWDRENGLAGDLFVINDWEETEDRQVKITATEHVPLTNGTRQADAGDPPPSGTGGDPPLAPGRCERIRVSAGTDTVYFNNGAMYPEGNYRIVYVRDAVMKTANSGYLVAGYTVVSTVAGTEAPIVAAPAVADPTGGYATMALAKAANIDQEATFTLTAAGAIGIVADVSTNFDNPDGNTIYELCFGKAVGGPDQPDPPEDPTETLPVPVDCTEFHARFDNVNFGVTVTSYNGDAAGETNYAKWITEPFTASQTRIGHDGSTSYNSSEWVMLWYDFPDGSERDAYTYQFTFFCDGYDPAHDDVVMYCEINACVPGKGWSKGIYEPKLLLKDIKAGPVTLTNSDGTSVTLLITIPGL